MSFARRAWSAFGKFGIVLSIIVIFVLGFVGTVYLSLRTSEVKVPSVLGKNRMAGESALDDAGLNIRVARTRASLDQKPDTILQQWPSEGQIVKTGQTVAVEISRAPKEGESVPSRVEVPEPEKANSNQNGNANVAAPANQNQNKPKNKNKNSNNSNSKNANTAANANNTSSNTGGRANANRPTTNGTPNSNGSQNANRSNANANKRPPAPKPPAGGNANKTPG